jgi:hypothetical protein
MLEMHIEAGPRTKSCASYIHDPCIVPYLNSIHLDGAADGAPNLKEY